MHDYCINICSTAEKVLVIISRLKLRYNKVLTESYWELEVKIYFLLPRGEIFPITVYT